MKIHVARSIAVAAVAIGLPGFCYSAQSVPAGELVVIGQRYQILSERMGDTLTYQVHRPANYEFSNVRYPVLIVLHADQFQHVSTTVDVLAAAGKIPEMLVVGVRSPDNFRDEIPAAAGHSQEPPARGGPANFLKFITEELIPKIDRDYRTHPYRVLVGHSSAALFTLYSMMNAPEVFHGYLVLSASFGDARGLPKMMDSFLQRSEKLNADVFMAVEDASGQTLTGAWELSSYLQERASRVRDVRFTFRRYPEDNHVSLPLRGVEDGLLSIFDGWQIEDPFKLYEQAGLAGVEKNFSVISSRLGYPVALPTETLISIFVALEGLKRFPEAEQVIKRAIELYPNNEYVHYYAGRLYLQMGNKPRAVEELTRSLKLSPGNDAPRALLTYLKVDAATIVSEVRLSQRDLDKYVGGYGNSEVVFEIVRRGEKIFEKTADVESELSAVSTAKFYDSNDDEVISFERDEHGRVTGVAFQNGGAELRKLK